MAHINYVGRLYENICRVEMHAHDSWEIVYYTKGSGIVEIDDEKISFEEKDIFAIPPNVPHTDYSESGFQNYHCNFTDPEFTHLTYLKCRDGENNEFMTVFQLLYHEYHLKRKNYRNIVENLCSLLLHYLNSLSEQAEGNHYISMAIHEIIANISNPYYDIQTTLQRIPLTEDYFRRLFYQETHKTPLQFLISKRISFAQQLLRTQKNSGISIHEISWRAGFTDNYYFSRVFKKQTGLSPKHWILKDEQHTTAEEVTLPVRYMLPED